jgi:hypothetical protein
LSIHYGGQFGHMHDADSVIESIHYALSQPDISEKVRFSFRVGGAQAARIEEAFRDVPVDVLPPLPSNEWRREIRQHHVGLVSLSPGGATVCLPSKSYSMMAGGLPILAICPEWSDLADMLSDTDAGWVIPNSPHRKVDPLAIDYLSHVIETESAEVVKERLVELLRSILDSPEEIHRKSCNAVDAMHTSLGKKEIGECWQYIIEGAIASNRG